jgi:hypothetical protein
MLKDYHVTRKGREKGERGGDFLLVTSASMGQIEWSRKLVGKNISERTRCHILMCHIASYPSLYFYT